MDATATAAQEKTDSVLDPVSKRLTKVRMKTHSDHVSLNAVYAPTNEDQSESEPIY